MTEPPKNFDEILIHLQTGRWNIIHFFGLSIGSFMVPSLVLAGSFLSPSVDYSCKPPSQQGRIIEVNQCDYVIEKRVGDTLLFVNQTEDCSTWSYDRDIFNVTLTSDFDLVCAYDYLRPTYQTVYMLGNFIGAPINGMLSDKFGRKSLFIGGLFLAISTVIVSSFFNDFTAILVFRFMTGLAHPSLIQTGYILAMEACEPKHRSLVGILFAFPWAAGTMWWGALGYLVDDWRWLQRISVIPGLIFIVFFMSIIDESARWLIVRGEHVRALKTLKRASKLNKTPLPSDEELYMNMEIIQKSSWKRSEDERRKSLGKPDSFISRLKEFFLQVLVLYKTPELRKRIFLMYVVFIVSSTVFYGIALNAVNFKLDPFMYMIVSGAMEVPAYTINVPIVAKFGRVLPTAVSFIVCGISIFALGFISNDIKWLVITFAMFGKYFISSAYQIIYLISSEAFPTEIKLQALGTCYFCSRIGSIVAPYITDFVGPKYPWIPSILFGVLSLIAGVAAIFIPETLNQPLPETIELLEEEALMKKNKRYKPATGIQERRDEGLRKVNAEIDFAEEEKNNEESTDLKNLSYHS